MSTIIPFSFPDTGAPIRVMTVDGEPWFVGGDVTSLLGYANGRDALAALPERMRNTVAIPDGKRGNPNRAIVSESGVYRLVMRSNLPAAERFQDWLAEEVIPSIRRTGSYSAAPPSLPDITTPAGQLALAQQFVRVAEQLVEADRRIAEMEPKAVAHDTYLSAQSGDRLVREVAKLLGWRQQDLRRFLVEEKLIFARQAPCNVTIWDFYAKNRAHFHAVEHPVEHTWGRCSHYTLYVRPAGVDLIQKRVTRWKADAIAALKD